MCGDKLCVSKLCVSKLCVDKLCVGTSCVWTNLPPPTMQATLWAKKNKCGGHFIHDS